MSADVHLGADVEIKWVEVPEAQDIWEGDIVDAEVDGEQVIIVHHLDGSYDAFQGLCPHQEVLLADGKWDEESCVIACPGHLWEFDMKKGDGINPKGSTLYRYPVKEQGGVVRVGIPQDGEAHYTKSYES
ncbi:Rieske 2Fe-2S domain-containing protein [Sinomonas sp. ASV486]|uniref:Rieske 2Fe-2S domain-containing protein n=1 Tax=Sinomonas sp. ASV486 TaxID=3051170 RepID=UPI0027DE19AB|nr:Rieske 2Fe-2S domain-containing protein [Sinomonas sp. ASV486]MDQ4490088.1 Rieske 2Fe-2S domain-containing protein [Sinomonas sp. ASV486]